MLSTFATLLFQSIATKITSPSTSFCLRVRKKVTSNFSKLSQRITVVVWRA